LKTALKKRGVEESLSDPRVFISKNMIVLCYVDDCILISKDNTAIPEFIESLTNGPDNFKFPNEGSMSSYLGVDTYWLPNDEGFTLTQSFLIDRIIKAINFDPSVTKGAQGNTPAGVSLAIGRRRWSPKKSRLELPISHWNAMMSSRDNTSRYRDGRPSTC